MGDKEQTFKELMAAKEQEIQYLQLQAGRVCEHETDEMRKQNRELSLTLEQFKHDCEILEAENETLKENLANLEIDHEQITEKHAQLLGHVNPKQKIRHIE